MTQRNQLFSNRGVNGRQNQQQTSFSEETQRLYEDQNNEAIDSLSSKVGALKHIALDIGREVKSHNTLLDGMENQMGSVGNLMNGAVSKLNDMIKSGGPGYMCLLIGGVVGLFCILYLLLSWR